MPFKETFVEGYFIDYYNFDSMLLHFNVKSICSYTFIKFNLKFNKIEN